MIISFSLVCRRCNRLTQVIKQYTLTPTREKHIAHLQRVIYYVANVSKLVER